MDSLDSVPGSGRFLTLADVAEILNIEVAEAKTLVESSEILAIRVGPRQQWRIEQSALEAYIAGRYEEQKRSAMFHGADYSNIIDMSEGR